MVMIKILPEQIANLIAAGEVVERPASVVKELVENALDAGARSIEVEANDAGFSYLRITDDGSGMSPEDARLAFQRHATSKLSVADDLNHILTFGFRGEALPSIASVARVELTTRPQAQAAGLLYRLEAGKVKTDQEIGCAAGSSLIVRDLFFNTPARRKFMKAPATERSHIVQAVEWIALANFGVRFKLILDGKEVLNCPATESLPERVLAVYGKQYPNPMVNVEQEACGVWVRGLLAAPEQSRPTRQGMLFFVNHRPVEHRGIAHAVLEAYRPFLAPGRFPYCLLFLDIPSEWVDVNVHPAKREVRLRDEHAVHGLVMQAVKAGLGNMIAQGRAPVASETHTDSAPGFRSFAGSPDNRNDAGSGYAVREAVATYLKNPPLHYEPLPLGFSSRAQDRTLAAESEAITVGGKTILGQAGRTYLAGSDADGFFLIDQHAAHERILYERFRRADPAAERQALLLPITLELPAARAVLLQGTLGAFMAVGFEISVFGKNTFVIQTQPRDLSVGDLTVWVNEILDWMIENGKSPAPEEFREHALQSMACHAAIKAGDRLQPEVVQMILRGIEKLNPPLTCPHGRPFILRWPWTELDRLFKRT